MTMTINYDTVADAVYVAMTNGAIAKTIVVNERLNMDVDADGNTIGIEILDASSQEDLVGNLKKSVEAGIPVSITTTTPSVA